MSFGHEKIEKEFWFHFSFAFGSVNYKKYIVDDEKMCCEEWENMIAAGSNHSIIINLQFTIYQMYCKSFQSLFGRLSTKNRKNTPHFSHKENKWNPKEMPMRMWTLYQRQYLQHFYMIKFKMISSFVFLVSHT